ncbi:hypothetical protein ACFQS7_05480 [Dankookia sp. GCM10030260]|uniref:hypothetical protein n=1 Tax=Dankookia sp. GCM10030260 TaxID=3273390 RepID=UPI0036234942
MLPLRFFALQVAIGFGAATLFIALLLLADPGGVGTLLLAPESGPLPLALFWLHVGLTFGSVQFAAALALAAKAPSRSDRGRGSLSVSPAYALAHAVRRPRSPSP